MGKTKQPISPQLGDNSSRGNQAHLLVDNNELFSAEYSVEELDYIAEHGIAELHKLREAQAQLYDFSARRRCENRAQQIIIKILTPAQVTALIDDQPYWRTASEIFSDRRSADLTRSEIDYALIRLTKRGIINNDQHRYCLAEYNPGRYYSDFENYDIDQEWREKFISLFGFENYCRFIGQIGLAWRQARQETLAEPQLGAVVDRLFHASMQRPEAKGGELCFSTKELLAGVEVDEQGFRLLDNQLRDLADKGVIHYSSAGGSEFSLVPRIMLAPQAIPDSLARIINIMGPEYYWQVVGRHNSNIQFVKRQTETQVERDIAAMFVKIDSNEHLQADTMKRITSSQITSALERLGHHSESVVRALQSLLDKKVLIITADRYGDPSYRIFDSAMRSNSQDVIFAPKSNAEKIELFLAYGISGYYQRQGHVYQSMIRGERWLQGSDSLEVSIESNSPLAILGREALSPKQDPLTLANLAEQSNRDQQELRRQLQELVDKRLVDKISGPNGPEYLLPVD